MSPEAPWRVRVEDIVAAVRRVLEYTRGMAKDEFFGDQKTIDAVVRNIEIIGEAAGRVPEGIQARAPEVAWAQMRGMRNVVIHEYDIVDVEIVWTTVQEDLPSLLAPLERLLSAEQDDEGKE